MKQTITESQLRQIVTESVIRVLEDEDMLDEGVFSTIRNGARAIGNSFAGNGSVRSNFYDMQYKDYHDDATNLMKKYGVQNGENGRQYVNNSMNNEQDSIMRAAEKKKEAIDRQAEVEKQKVDVWAEQEISKKRNYYQSQWDEYNPMKKKLNAKRDKYFRLRDKEINRLGSRYNSAKNNRTRFGAA